MKAGDDIDRSPLQFGQGIKRAEIAVREAYSPLRELIPHRMKLCAFSGPIGADPIIRHRLGAGLSDKGDPSDRKAAQAMFGIGVPEGLDEFRLIRH